nr:MAG TPA: head tail adaptor [Caudoviricetes sp.]
MQNPKKNKYIDGMVYFYLPGDAETSFGAKKNPKSVEDMKFFAKLAYTEKSKRQQDYENANQNGYELSKKIVTPLYKKVDNKMKVVDDGYIYDIISVDYDRVNSEMYLMLHEVRKVETNA